MKTKNIIFTKPYTAELTDGDLPETLGPDQVLVRTVFSTVSPGTERAVICDSPNCGGYREHVFPRQSGYSSAGYVLRTGEKVKSVSAGDRVIVFWGKHSSYNLVPERQVVKIEDEFVTLEEAAVVFISTFSLAAIRKCRLEIGEKALVMGCGLLGQFAVRLLRAAGAAPIVAVDTVAERRAEAQRNGADYVFDPTDPDFAAKVKAVTGGGVNVAIEVTGVGAGLDEALDCMARYGRIALLGCTRDKNFTIDYYQKIHTPGITVVGAHTKARPEHDSHPGWFTQRDDIKAVLRLLAAGRIDFRSMLPEAPFSPAECGEVYDRVIRDRSFPTLAQFDWRTLESEE
ncbi:MAG: zinc-binding alcohol dehydrogenase [Clostridia bacterium]|nr:zinc-binding alcohol dehydrogenase [Clostridia bacterium]